MQLDFLGSLNEWYPFPEKMYSYQVLCAGFDFREPQMSFTENSFAFTFELKETPINMDWWCENILNPKQDPRLIHKHKRDSMEKQLSEYKEDRFYYFVYHFIHCFSKQLDHLEYH